MNNEILTSNSATTPLTGDASSPKKPVNKKLIIAIIAALVLVGAGLAVYFLVIKPNSSSSSSQVNPEETSQIDPNTAPAEIEIVWGEDETDSSGEAYVAYQESIVNGSGYSEAEKFTAILSLANYDISIERFAAAEERLLAINVSSLSTEDTYRYYSVLTHLYEQSGDTQKRDEYNALSVEYRNRLIAESSEE
ncbi:hypothetical protein IJI17_01275 [Candidatus Saccharibacteria bacterium]|nr:hypothetical protein [Candidatus Saccharibacteria bacterium]